MHRSFITAIVAALAGFLFFNSRASAQESSATNIPEANVAAPFTNATTVKLNRTLPILFIVGDSTVHNSAKGLLGWGDVVGRYFDPKKIIVENHARPGRSSRTFQTQGWWDKVMARARPGDFVMIQMGHNDGGPLDDTNRARGTIPGIGDESRQIYNPVMQRPEIVHTYGWYMRKYINDARAEGMTPIICSPVPHVPKDTVNTNDEEKSDYVVWSRKIAEQEHVFFIPLNRLIMAHYVGMTPKEVKARYFTTQDNTHASPEGAALNASAVIEGLRTLKGCPLNDYLYIGDGNLIVATLVRTNGSTAQVVLAMEEIVDEAATSNGQNIKVREDKLVSSWLGKKFLTRSQAENYLAGQVVQKTYSLADLKLKNPRELLTTFFEKKGADPNAWWIEKNTPELRAYREPDLVATLKSFGFEVSRGDVVPILFARPKAE
jgi:lysophospholipase L1-like esterase